MLMTDRELCVAVLGWNRLTDTKRLGAEYCKAYLVRSDGEHWPPPDFDNDIEATMKLADAVCDVVEWELTCHIRRRSQLVRADGYKKYHAEFLNIDRGEVHEADNDELAAAIRAAVMKVYEAHEPKGA